jgi:hypothetical protein
MSISEFALKMNELSDKANATVKKVEDYLASKNIGLKTEIQAGLDKLVYVRVDSRYRIAVESNGSLKAWSDTTRETKLETFVYLPNLLKAIFGKLKHQLVNNENVINRTIVEIESVLSNYDQQS